MEILKSTLDLAEVLVERVKPQRFAEASSNYEHFHKRFNEMRAAHLAAHSGAYRDRRDAKA